MAYSKKKIKANYGTFLRQYTRKKQKNWDSNDRSYDRKLEKILRRMKPEDLWELICEEDDGSDTAPAKD